MTQRLIIFCKNPVMGNVKTRLAASIGDEKAMAVYLHLLHHTRAVTRPLAVAKHVYYSDYIDREDDWENALFTKEVQAGSNLGQRMENAFASAFNEGSRRICIIGTDCLELSADIVSDAFLHLANHDAVLGPARDGGYYLLGLAQQVTDVFRNKQWSTDHVADDTLNDFRRLGLRVRLLPMLSDIDTVDDLPLYLKKKFHITS